ncbi:hypothetical protein ACLQ8T_05630 [Glutamicibacter sp. FR1]|uniref:hypothetical protein n=1 Tax=Glutamicibacter sp. FR1 TaxID=3393744 RepID=UPI0039B0373B
MSENGLHKIPAMRAALEAIQELHKPVETQVLTGDCAVGECEHEDDCPTVDFVYCAACNEIAELANAYYAEEGMQIVSHPCPTRRLADQGLGDNLARTTKNGENND